MERSFENIDLQAFSQELEALRNDVDSKLGEEDIRHFKKLMMWSNTASALGYGTAWIMPNPISAFLMSVGMTSRWTVLMHHLGHKAFDRVPGAPEAWKSKTFGAGKRRFWDFPDWMLPEAWNQEHNVLHHYFTGESGDPDLVERDVDWLRDAKVPLFVKYLFLAVFSVTWKATYYVPRVMRALQYARARREGKIGPSVESTGGKATCEFPADTRGLGPRHGSLSLSNARGREIWMRSYVPYVLYRFVLLPTAFLLLGPWAAFSVLMNSIMAEAMSNLHTFLVIAPNHCGDDVFRFYEPKNGKGEFYLRSILGSANCNTGKDWSDFMQGYLNYQIEHHLWPDLAPYRYKELQPKVKALCEKYGVPYVQESMWKRVPQLLRIMSGQTSMQVGVKTGGKQAAAAASKEASDVGAQASPA